MKVSIASAPAMAPSPEDRPLNTDDLDELKEDFNSRPSMGIP